MTITRVQKVVNNKNTGADQTSLVLTVPAVTVTAGNLLVICITGVRFTTPTVTVADSKSNTYQQDRMTKSALFDLSYIFTSKLTTNLVNADTITCTFNAALNQPSADATEYTGQATSSWLDQATGAIANSTSPNSGALTPAQDGSLLIGCCGYNSTGTYAATGSWGLLNNLQNAGGGGKGFASEEQIQVTAASVAATGTLSTGSDWAQSLAIYKPAVAVAQPRFGFSSFQDPAVFMRRQLSGLLVPERKVWLPT